MSKVTITITDKPLDMVKIECNPTFETMAMMNNSGEKMTAAQGYAVAMLNRAREISKEENPMSIVIPKVKGSSL